MEYRVAVLVPSVCGRSVPFGSWIFQKEGGVVGPLLFHLDATMSVDPETATTTKALPIFANLNFPFNVR